MRTQIDFSGKIDIVPNHWLVVDLIHQLTGLIGVDGG